MAGIMAEYYRIDSILRLLQNSRRKIASEASSVRDVVVSVSLSWLSLPDWSIFPDATRVDPAAVATTR